MNRWHERGFTLIELMVSLVVAGILMAGLVALSGSVQRSFGRSKEIVDLQSRLRMGMMRLTDDLKRAAYMYALKPGSNSKCNHTPAAWQGLTIPEQAAISYVKDVLALRGNYVSSRDYRVRLDYAANQATILCRNASPYDPDPDSCRVPTDNFNNPFGDGPGFDNLFCEDVIVRLNMDGEICHYTATNTSNSPLATVNFSENLVGQRIACDELSPCYINPVTSVQYWLENQGPRGPAGAVRWTLQRRTDDCASNSVGNPAVPLIENLLPFDDPHAPGLEIQVYVDTNYQISNKTPSSGPDIKLDQSISLIPPDIGVVDWMQARALGVTLRARTDTEDPNFVIHDYDSDPAKAKNYGFDLDGIPQNGLAYVRVAHMLVGLRNLSLKAHPVQNTKNAK